MLVVSEVCALRYQVGDVGGRRERRETGAVGRSEARAAVGVAEEEPILAAWRSRPFLTTTTSTQDFSSLSRTEHSLVRSESNLSWNCDLFSA